VAGNEVVPRADEDERDLNSFMYQTVGHQVIPLYAEATGIPLYRRAITGGATQHGKDYSHHRSTGSPSTTTPAVVAAAAAGANNPGAGGGGGGGLSSGEGGASSGPDHGHGRREAEASASATATAAADDDETESMIPLLRAIKQAHPEANAICAGAILSTYQRTRVESVATRLGLVPLAYLWKYPVLPGPRPGLGLGSDSAGADNDAQLLDDMAAAGLEARIIKVASGGLDEGFLWTNVASAAGKGRLARAMRRFGAAAAAETGAVIGEGGEFETLVLDGPAALFRKRIVVEECDRRVVREGGGSAWLSLRNARLEDKGGELDGAGGAASGGPVVRVPGLLDSRFVGVMDALSSSAGADDTLQSSPDPEIESPSQFGTLQPPASERLQQWSFVGSKSGTVEEETHSIVEQVRQRLRQQGLPPSAIISATVILRRMADFPTVNNIYSTLFDAPNPPSRVTISCGDAAAANITVYLTVHTALQPSQRQGLHVQSRSYWAPANIGPYSQAISVPVSSLGGSSVSDTSSSSGVRLVSIAGQIPLIPATMALPAGGNEDTLPLQLSLSLQHLWRIGLEMGVQWWTSAVAYFPASLPGQEKDMSSKAKAASKAWTAAHAPPTTTDSDDDDDETGPDLWDRRYNPAYMTFSGDGSTTSAAPSLPDRSVLAATNYPVAVPPLFVAEVDALPRGAAVEWHAHLGVARAAEGAVCVRRRVSGEGGGVVVSQVVVDGFVSASTSEEGDGEGDREECGVRFVQTTVAERWRGEEEGGRGVVVVVHGDVAREALAQLGGVGFGSGDGELAAVVRYVDAAAFTVVDGEGVEGIGPVVPCQSLWGGEGERLAAVTVYQSVFE
jgi:diphthine-ammonia ligase